MKRDRVGLPVSAFRPSASKGDVFTELPGHFSASGIDPADALQAEIQADAKIARDLADMRAALRTAKAKQTLAAQVAAVKGIP